MEVDEALKKFGVDLVGAVCAVMVEREERVFWDNLVLAYTRAMSAQPGQLLTQVCDAAEVYATEMLERRQKVLGSAYASAQVIADALAKVEEKTP